MKKSFIFAGLVFLIFAVLLHSCKKGEVPTLTTSEVTEIKATTATCGGTITNEGSGTVVERGICWSKKTNPTIADNKTIDGAGAGTFLSNLADLDPATVYYVRAYATNNAGTGYGMTMSFTSLILPPTGGLVAYYPFNGNANDESGNNLNGTVFGATLTADRNGASNKAYYFNGTSSYIKVLSSTLLNLPKFTIALWVNVERFGGSSAEGGFILSKGVFPNYNYVLSESNVNNVHALDASTTSNGIRASFSSSRTFNATTWYFFVVTNDGSNLKIIFDTILNGSVATGTSDTNNNDVYIGRYEGDMRWHFKGIIDDIRIYNRALTETEIQALYNEQ